MLAAWCLTAAAPVRAADPRPVGLWIPGNPDGLAARQMTFLTKRIEERLPHRLQILPQTGAACPPEAELLAQIKDGRIELATMGDALIDEVPRLSVFRLPWLFANRDHVQRALYAGLEDEIRTHVEQSVPLIVVGIYENGFRQIRADRPIASPDDLAQRKILVNEGRKLRDLWRALGAVPQKYPTADAAEALEKGIVDSFDGHLDTLLRLPIGERAPIITLTRHVYEPTFLVASKRFWHSLDNTERAALTEIGLDFADTAAQLAGTYQDSLSKRLPRKLKLMAMSPHPFAPVTAQHRAAYERTYGSDWLDLIDAAADGEPAR